jgi:Asp-tRNA(Asn)/Glu-tRNA(Gln) amidotransferase C subunit
MAISPEIRAIIEGRLSSGERAIDIASEYEGIVHYNTIKGWENRLRAIDKQDNDIDILKQASASKTLTDLAERAKEEASPAIVGQIETIVDGVEGLNKLDSKFHEVLYKAIEVGEKFLQEDDLKLGDWKVIVNTLSQAYASVFKSNGTNVQINQNTQINSGKVSGFKASLRS